MDTVAGVKQGLEEGVGDVANQVKASEANKPATAVTKEMLLRRECVRSLPKIFLPRVLHRDDRCEDGYRLFDYERDVLGDLDWESFSYLNADNFQLVNDKLQHTIARIDYKMSKDNQGELDLAAPVQENIEFDASVGLDISFMVRQLTDVISNPWQAMRVLTHCVIMVSVKRRCSPIALNCSRK